MTGILAEILRGRHPADVNFRPPALALSETTEQEPASFLDGPLAQIEQAHVFTSKNGSQPPQETVVFQPPAERAPGKHYIKPSALPKKLNPD